VNAEIVAAARRWIGTPYCHQAAAKGSGCDCLGLVRGVWLEVLGAEPETVPAYAPDWSEATGDESLWRAARRHLREKQARDAGPGDVILFRMRDGAVAKHLGIMATEASFIHSYSGHGVVESALTMPWQRRIVAAFSFLEGRT
jgi:NlpC/P60 family putative phage cell wall peptidase